jgi:hypothetical protein
MGISLHDIESLLNAYNKRQRVKNGSNKSPEETVNEEGEAVIDEVTLSKQRIEKTDTPDKISEKLIEGLLKNEKNK